MFALAQVVVMVLFGAVIGFGVGWWLRLFAATAAARRAVGNVDLSKRLAGLDGWDAKPFPSEAILDDVAAEVMGLYRNPSALAEAEAASAAAVSPLSPDEAESSPDNDAGSRDDDFRGVGGRAFPSTYRGYSM